MMNFYNAILETYHQDIRIIQWSGTSITLSSGVILTNNIRLRFLKRIANTKTDVWATHADKLLSGEIDVEDLKYEGRAKGGRLCQQKHGAKSKLNLNTGTPWNKGLKGSYPYKFGPCSQEVKDKISAKNSGPGNGMYGTKMSMIDKKRRSDIMKEKILSGEFTPNSNNRNTHWDARYENKCYRSSWEALYQYINPHAEYEQLRIKYSINNTTKIYIVDFVDHINKQVVEVKPRELCAGEKFQAKLTALTIWAELNKYTLIIADKEWLQLQDKNIDYTKFDANTARKIKVLYETNKTN